MVIVSDDFPGMTEAVKALYPLTEHQLCYVHLQRKPSKKNLNRRIEQIRMKLGRYFQSVSILEVNRMLQIDGLKQGKWKKPVPILKAKAYDLLQLVNIKFYRRHHNLDKCPSCFQSCGCGLS